MCLIVAVVQVTLDDMPISGSPFTVDVVAGRVDVIDGLYNEVLLPNVQRKPMSGIQVKPNRNFKNALMSHIGLCSSFGFGDPN